MLAKSVFSFTLSLILLAGSTPCMQAAGAESGSVQTEPQALVGEFYTWYVATSAASPNLPILDDAIYKFVYPCTVKRCRIDLKKGIVSADYFLQSNDFDPEFYADATPHEPIQLGPEVCMVPLGFRGTHGEPILIVFVQNDDGELRISKVEAPF